MSIPVLFDPQRGYCATFAPTLICAFIPPLIISHVLLQTFSFSSTFRVVLLLAAVPCYLAVKIQLGLRRNARAAQRLGCILPLEVKGRWIGNINILLR